VKGFLREGIGKPHPLLDKMPEKHRSCWNIIKGMAKEQPNVLQEN